MYQRTLALPGRLVRPTLPAGAAVLFVKRFLCFAMGNCF